MRCSMRRGFVDMSADAKAKLWILVQDLAWSALVCGQVLGNKLLVQRDLRHQSAHRLFPGRPGICLKGVANIRAQLLQRIGHLFPPMLVCVTSRVFIIRCIGAGKPARRHRHARNGARDGLFSLGIIRSGDGLLFRSHSRHSAGVAGTGQSAPQETLVEGIYIGVSLNHIYAPRNRAKVEPKLARCIKDQAPV
jgi:hypothetical protein